MPFLKFLAEESLATHHFGLYICVCIGNGLAVCTLAILTARVLLKPILLRKRIYLYYLVSLVTCTAANIIAPFRYFAGIPMTNEFGSFGLSAVVLLTLQIYSLLLIFWEILFLFRVLDETGWLDRVLQPLKAVTLILFGLADLACILVQAGKTWLDIGPTRRYLIIIGTLGFAISVIVCVAIYFLNYLRQLLHKYSELKKMSPEIKLGLVRMQRILLAGILLISIALILAVSVLFDLNFVMEIIALVIILASTFPLLLIRIFEESKVLALSKVKIKKGNDHRQAEPVVNAVSQLEPTRIIDIPKETKKMEIHSPQQHLLQPSSHNQVPALVPTMPPPDAPPYEKDREDFKDTFILQ